MIPSTRVALASNAGLSRYLPIREVKGIGTEHVATQQYRGSLYDMGFIPRTLLEIVIVERRGISNWL